MLHVVYLELFIEIKLKRSYGFFFFFFRIYKNKTVFCSNGSTGETANLVPHKVTTS